jgi:endonuclease YncB( thermonuclease family)
MTRLPVLLILALAFPCLAKDDPFASVQYVGNRDGDTFTVNLSDSIPAVFGHEISVRIRHIDTAEMTDSSKCGKESALKAKAAVEAMLKNAGAVSLENVGRDKYFRLLADVKADGVSVGQYLLAQKLAVPYEGEAKPKTDWCKLAKKRKK